MSKQVLHRTKPFENVLKMKRNQIPLNFILILMTLDSTSFDSWKKHNSTKINKKSNSIIIKQSCVVFILSTFMHTIYVFHATAFFNHVWRCRRISCLQRSSAFWPPTENWHAALMLSTLISFHEKMNVRRRSIDEYHWFVFFFNHFLMFFSFEFDLFCIFF